MPRATSSISDDPDAERAPCTSGRASRRARARVDLAAAVSLLCVTLATSAAAQTKGAVKPAPAAKAATPKAQANKPDPAPKSAPPKKLHLPAVAAELDGVDSRAAGLADVEAAGSKAKTLAPRVEELLAKGLPADLTTAAIRALGAIGAATSSAVIAPYVQHRSADIRKAAAVALAKTRGPDAATGLRGALRSSDAEVRVLAATGLAEVGDPASIPDLVLALDRGIAEAGPSIAAICTGADCDGLFARLDKLALDKQQVALEAMLRRKPALSDAIVLRMIDAAKAKATETRKAYFSSLHRSFRGSLAVSKALDAASRWEPKAAPKKAAEPALDPPGAKPR